jgi:hypothetical protein
MRRIGPLRSQILGVVISPVALFPTGLWLTFSFIDPMKPLLRVLGYLVLCFLFTLLLVLSALAGN